MKKSGMEKSNDGLDINETRHKEVKEEIRKQ